MPGITIIVVIVFIGLVLYLIEKYAPRSQANKPILRVAAVLGLCV
jgi:hypothetical protein